MFDHLSIGVTELARSGAFYDAALGPLGHVRIVSNEKCICYGPKGFSGGEPPFAILPIKTVFAPPVRFHLAFSAKSREEVAAFHAGRDGAGGVDEGGPGIRYGEDSGYYAAFAFDPDGHRVEAVLHELTGPKSAW